jgi:hypothetical protein
MAGSYLGGRQGSRRIIKYLPKLIEVAQLPLVPPCVGGVTPVKTDSQVGNRDAC